MKQAFFVFSFFFALVLNANAQIHVQPTEIIVATPLTAFSERLGVWPSSTTPSELLLVETGQLSRELNVLPGVRSRESGSPTISIRGSAQAGRTLTLFDGVPLVLADGFGAPKLLIPQEILAETRLLKGPGSVFYGPAALAGAVNHVPRVFDENAVRLAANHQGTGIANFNQLGVVPVRWGSEKQNFLQYSLYHENDPGDFSFESVSSTARGSRQNNDHDLVRHTVLGKQQSDKWLVQERFIFADYDGNTPGSVKTPSPAPFDSQAHLAAVAARTKINNHADAGLELSQIRNKYVYNAGNSSAEPTTFTRELLSGDFNYTFGNAIVAKSFFDLAHDRIQSNNLNEEFEFSENLELGQTWIIPLGQNWQLQPGARWLTEFDDLVAAIGVTRNWESDRAWLTYSEGFRRPSLYDLFLTNSFAVANPNLKPENAWQVEFGFAHEPDLIQKSLANRISWSVAAYYIGYDDIFENEPVSPTASTKVNRGKAQSYGAEAAVGFSESSRTYSLSYNHLQSHNKTFDEPLPFSPRHQVTATFTQGLGPVQIEIRNTYSSKFYDREFGVTQMQSLPDTNLTDLNIRTLALSEWEIKAGVLNLFDRPQELTLGYPEPQRSFYVSVLRFF